MKNKIARHSIGKSFLAGGFILILLNGLNPLFSEDIALSTNHKEKVEKLFLQDLNQHGGKKKFPMFTVPLNRFTSDKKKQDENASIEDEKYKKLLDRIIKLEAQLAEKQKKADNTDSPLQEDWELQLEKDLDSQKKNSEKQKGQQDATATDNANNPEEWEEQLERELRQQKAQSKKSQNSRNTNSPTVQKPTDIQSERSKSNDGYKCICRHGRRLGQEQTEDNSK
ncbi:MAG: hypothetical protein IPG24_25410 [Leptospiraceae bacterium]|nr:hypothetical protein [Leptospiraceae bacterium]